MSSAVLSTSAALGRPFVFDAKADPEVYSPFGPAPDTAQTRPPQPVRPAFPGNLAASDPKLAGVTSASRLGIRPGPEMVSSGIGALDALTGGLPRGCLTEVFGPATSGRTTLFLAALAAATSRGEFCAVIDANDTLDPHSISASGIDLDRLLWVRCGEDSPQKENPPQRHRDTEKKGNQKQMSSTSSATFAPEGGTSFTFDRARSIQADHRLEQVLRATDLLLESGGFGLIVLDLADLPPQAARRIPLTTWFRFRRAVEHKHTILLAIEQQPIAGSCSSLLLQLSSPIEEWEKSCATSAAKRRKNAAHGASRGVDTQNTPAPEGRKKTHIETFDDDLSTLPHTHLLTGLNIRAELIHSRLDRKPTHSITFATKTAWAG